MYVAPIGFAGLYVHYLTISNLRILLHEFVYEVLDYFHVYLSRLNPFGCAKLITFAVMCKSYGGEPTVDLFRGFLNLNPAEDWLTFAKRSKAEAHAILLKPISCLETFPDPIIYLVILKSSQKHSLLQPAIFIGGKEMSFLPKEPSNEFGIGSPSSSINKEDMFVDVEPLASANPNQLIENFVKTEGSSVNKTVMVVPGGSVAERIKNQRCRKKGIAKAPVKRKLGTFGSPQRIIHQKSAKAKVESSSYLAIFDDDDD
ncbi:hypothetical protein Tco_1120930 [Tanacetum coccineum]|uniref:Transposase (putative) gypsy type domain-containing protein n=1 Tax=Tanacetum coccineum TaxID=301880 RepID=A0ABQ5IWA4_9ASTR